MVSIIGTMPLVLPLKRYDFLVISVSLSICVRLFTLGCWDLLKTRLEYGTGYTLESSV